MAEITKETITTEGSSNPVVTTPVTTKDSSNPILTTQVKTGASTQDTMEYLIYFFFGLLEVLLAFRLILKMTGANLASGFVSFVYTLTGILILPFEGIFRRASTQTGGTTSVFEPSTLVAIIVYAVLAWGIVKLVRISSGEKQDS